MSRPLLPGLPWEKATRIPEREVYVISCGDYAMKIGVATDPVKRLLTLQCGNPQPLRLIFATGLVQGWVALQVEADCHAYFRGCGWGLSGEWVRTNPEYAAKVVRVFTEIVKENGKVSL